MVQSYPTGTDVTITVAFPIVDGDYVVPSVVEFAVLDETGTIVLPRAALVIDPLAGDEISAEVPGVINTVPTGSIRALRVVEFYFTTPTGEYPVVARYVVEKTNKLVIMTNSFQTYEQAILTRLDMPALDGWDAADEDSQIAAMVTAHDRMCRLSYRYRLGDSAVEYSENRVYYHITDIRRRTTVEYASWESAFKQALNRAQLFEADQILKGDPIGDKRREGVVSETIGESKMFLNPRPPLRLALCRAAIETLGPHIYTSVRLGRA